MGRCGRAVLGAALALAAAAASAQPAQQPDAPPPAADYERSGAYLGIAGSYVIPLSEGALEDSFGPPVDVDPGIGLVLRAGWRFSPLLAAELDYEWLDEFDLQTTGVDDGVQQGHVLVASAKLYPFTGLLVARYQPYAIAGIGVQWTEVRTQNPGDPSFDRARFAARMGIGSEVYLDEHWLLAVEGNYTRSTGSLSDFDSVSVVFGGGYRF